MTLVEQDWDHTTVLKPMGRWISLGDVNLFEDKVKDLVHLGRVRVVVDLSEMDWIGASFLGVLIESLEILRNRRGDLRLACASLKIKKILILTGLAEDLPVLETVGWAVLSLEIDACVSEPEDLALSTTYSQSTSFGALAAETPVKAISRLDRPVDNRHLSQS